jgi:flagellar motor switch protein FliG
MVADIRKVALLISLLSRPLAASLIGRLPQEYRALLHHCLDELTDIDVGERQRVVHEFLSSCEPANPRRYRVDASGSQPPSFHFLLPLPPGRIVELLGDEMPQAQAVVLSRLPHDTAEEVLARMSEDRRQQVAQRLKCLPTIPSVTISDIAQVYRRLVVSG